MDFARLSEGRARSFVVTGGAGGLGRAICQAAAEAGARVVVADLDGDRAAGFARTLGGGAIGAALDVGDEQQWIELFDRLDALDAVPDVLVNNAGIFHPNIALEAMTLETWRAHFRVNADGVFLGCKHAILRMGPHGGGAVVNMGSGMSVRPVPTAAAYCASKSAVLMTTRVAAWSGGPHKVRVNAVLPGAVETDMLMGNLLPDQTRESFLADMASHSALGRLATAQDVARAVLFLADRRNDAVSGTWIAVDAGVTPG